MAETNGNGKEPAFPRWVAIIVIGFFCAVSGTCFALSTLARADASENAKVVAVQGKEIEFLRRDISDLKELCKETNAKLDRILANQK